jgi:hypothetical protein
MFRKKTAGIVLAAMAFAGLTVPAAAAAGESDATLKAAGLQTVALDELGQLGVDQGPFYLMSRQPVRGVSQCLDLAESVGDGKQIVTHDCHFGDNQKWWVNSNGVGSVDVELKTHKYRTECADVYNSTGPTISRYPCMLQNNQRWELQFSGYDKYYRWKSHLDPAGSRNRCLDMAGDGTRRALLFECRGTGNQDWTLVVAR